MTVHTRLMRRGYIDRKDGKPLMHGKEFDALSLICQRQYEEGRLIAANILAAGLALPEWPEGTQMPAELKYAETTADRKVGRPLGKQSHLDDEEPGAPFTLDRWRQDVLQSVT